MTNKAIECKKTISRARIFQQEILNWYDQNGRDLPWRYRRYKGGQRANPYHVWLSEIMLQQTTVTAVKPYFEKFLTLWPCVQDLASASQEEVMHAWAGLGYYSRARNLHKAAQVIAFAYGGVFPSTQKAILKLPGVGDYTSAAIASIAFGEAATVIDGNIERIFSRYFAFDGELPARKKDLKARIGPYFQTCHARAGDLAQGLMDIGSGICTPKNSSCLLCPVQERCAARALGEVERFPNKAKKKAKDIRSGFVYIITNDLGEMLFDRRPDSGLLASTLGLPTSDWASAPSKAEHLECVSSYEVEPLNFDVKHIFTHFELTLYLWRAHIDSKAFNGHNRYVWRKDVDIYAAGMPSLFQRVYKLYKGGV